MFGIRFRIAQERRGKKKTGGKCLDYAVETFPHQKETGKRSSQKKGGHCQERRGRNVMGSQNSQNSKEKKT